MHCNRAPHAVAVLPIRRQRRGNVIVAVAVVFRKAAVVAAVRLKALWVVLLVVVAVLAARKFPRNRKLPLIRYHRYRIYWEKSAPLPHPY
jgi:hypothetical protein